MTATPQEMTRDLLEIMTVAEAQAQTTLARETLLKLRDGEGSPRTAHRMRHKLAPVWRRHRARIAEGVEPIPPAVVKPEPEAAPVIEPFDALTWTETNTGVIGFEAFESDTAIGVLKVFGYPDDGLWSWQVVRGSVRAGQGDIDTRRPIREVLAMAHEAAEMTGRP